MTELERARAKVAELEKLEKPVRVTIADKQAIHTMVAVLNRIIDGLGVHRDDRAGNGGGATRIKALDDIRDRLDKLEARTAPTVVLPKSINGAELISKFKQANPIVIKSGERLYIVDHPNTGEIIELDKLQAIIAGQDDGKNGESDLDKMRRLPWCANRLGTARRFFYDVRHCPGNIMTGSVLEEYHETREEAEAYAYAKLKDYGQSDISTVRQFGTGRTHVFSRSFAGQDAGKGGEA